MNDYNLVDKKGVFLQFFLLMYKKLMSPLKQPIINKNKNVRLKEQKIIMKMIKKD